MAAAGDIRRVCVVGTGVIGAGWAARCLAHGLDVIATDPHPEAEARLRASIDNAWPSLERIGLAPGADRGRLRFEPDLESAVAEADFIQENAPEVEDLKIALHARIDAAAGPSVVVASSSSGLLPSRIQSACKHPERMVIGHPFNPVYILPLVEVLGGGMTGAAALEAAAAFYAAIGMNPLRINSELPGYISDRLQEAMWREALHNVAEGAATTEQIDAAITDGPGLRLALMGPCLTYHLGGGDGGMAHMLEQFGPALKLPWTKLEAPELTETLRRRMIEGTSRQAGGRSVKQLERERDDFLIGVLELRENTRADRYAGRDFQRWQAGAAVAAPLALHEGAVEAAWVDYNAHMSESFYLYAFGDASDALFRYIGIDEAYRASGRSFYTVESHINYFREASLGDPLRFTTQLLDLDHKRLHLFHAMFHGESGALLATTEQMLLHVDSHVPKTTPIPPDIRAALDAIMAAHGGLERPEQMGRRMAIKG